ncbi:MAG: MogA/MoaB family molybdenum cofactor biosynthesis protein [Candidatus Competibacteraceae bacterium]|nr:MAG: MogA/MoaB family molybdenum cofactor biosynthesis protein [Candidatus Competibacteraceae bacterium]
MKAAILTASDRGARGEREDASGRVLRELLSAVGAEIVDYRIVPDELDLVAGALVAMADGGVDLICTTGGTGLGPRDVTPDATLQVIQRRVPGIPEAIRAASLPKTQRAMLSRAEAGVRGKTLIVNLPGSPNAVRECLEVVLPVLSHAVEVLRGGQLDCARDREAPA